MMMKAFTIKAIKYNKNYFLIKNMEENIMIKMIDYILVMNKVDYFMFNCYWSTFVKRLLNLMIAMKELGV